MSGSNGHACPECGAPRQPNGTPSCGCTRRASDALRDARTAQAAAAEDFDPLRIRPYVELGSAAAGTKSAGPSDETVPMVAVPAEAGASGVGLFPEGDVPDGDFREGDFPEDDAEPGYGSSGPGAPTPPARDEPPLRRRRTVLLASGGVLAAVVAAAGLAGGFFSYDAPQRDGALPDDVRASVPEASSAEASVPAAGSESAARPSAGSASPSPSASSSPSASASSRAPSRSGPATPSGTPTTARATGSVRPTSGNDRDQPASPVLQRGDKGPEVTELQLRLSQLVLYTGNADGTYSSQVEASVRNYQLARGITTDDQGVYGAATRASLESETSEP
ncbi:peptidoglycan-binding domain-containing protein [Streptomyces avermitilis]|uniref:peptidoglycan-binding domain-containing protein n=1 Tax=Streptomyces avermitilis TaxID=33903 RepID=UPI00368EB447